MKSKPFQFIGPCAACGNRHNDKCRGGINVEIDEDKYAWICLACAKRLAGMLLNAVDKCRRLMSEGLEFRNDRWQSKNNSTKKQPKKAPNATR